MDSLPLMFAIFPIAIGLVAFVHLTLDFYRNEVKPKRKDHEKPKN